IPELNEWPFAQLQDGADVAHNVLDRPFSIALTQHDSGGTEVTAPRTATRSLNRETVVGPSRQQVVAGNWQRADIDQPKGGCVPEPLHGSLGDSLYRQRPDVFTFADEYIVGMLECLVGPDAHMEPAHRHLDTLLPQPVGHGICFESLGRKRVD